MSTKCERGLSRRQFIKTGSCTAAAVPFLSFDIVSATDATPGLPAAGLEETIVNTCSTFDCGGKCDIRAHIQGGKLVRITSVPEGEMDPEMPVMRACVRGRGYRKFINHPDRLKYPMRRIGKRGEGNFQRISWEEATTIIADRLTALTAKHGPACRFVAANTAAVTGVFNGDWMVKRLLNQTGGYLSYYHGPSLDNSLAATPYTYGTPMTGSTLDTLLDSKLVILWGHNPAESIIGHTNHYLEQIKRNGTRIIVVDPRYSDSAMAYADQWIPLLPCSDNALMDALMYVIHSEGLHDQQFIDTYTIGFDEDTMPEGVPEDESLVAYLTGVKDGIKKTPEWAEKITKVPANTIRQLALDYATARPAALMQGWGPQRHYCGERAARAATLLASITGNVGISGGWAAGVAFPANWRWPAHPDTFENPVQESISLMNWIDAIDAPERVTSEVGLKGGDRLKSPIKVIFQLGGNYLVNQHPNVNRSAKVLDDESKAELIVVSELFETPTAKFADILLPETSFAERWNLGYPYLTGDYIMLSQKLIEPEFERRSDYEWLSEVAHKLGVGETFTEGRTEKAWIQSLWQQYRATYATENLPTFEELQVTGKHLFKSSLKTVAFKDQIDDIEKNPFPTPSGKIEIFSEALYDMNHPEIPALSHYVPSPETFADTERVKKYPLQLITWKPATRVNSSQFNNPWMQEAEQQELWINPIDAESRGIEDGEQVSVYNDRGIVMIRAKVTPRIIPSVVGLANGAWRNVDKDGVDHGGCANSLSSELITPMSKGFSNKTMLVEVEAT